MENLERTHFVVLTGHTDKQPLPDLIRTLRVQRKSGRLQVEYKDGPGSFFFEDGQLIDAELGALRGVEAIYAALSLEGGSYNFNPLVRPPERNIDGQGQKFVTDLIESQSGKGLSEIKVARGETGEAMEAAALSQRAQLQLPPAAEVFAPLQERLTAVEEAIVSTSRRFSRERLIYACVIGFLVGLSLITTLAVAFGPLRLGRTPDAQSRPAPVVGPARDVHPAAAPDPSQERGEPVQSVNTNQNTEQVKAQPPEPSTAALIATRKEGGVSVPRGGYVVQVLVEVKNGRVTDARVWNPRPGAAVYEAVALRMARERRYPENFTGGERLKIIVKP